MNATFVPADLDAARLDAVEPLIRSLLTREVGSSEALERWVRDRSELAAAISEGRARLYIAMTCNTEDTGAQGAYAAYIQTVAPRLTELAFELDKRLVELAQAHPLPSPRYDVLLRNTRADVEVFRPENVPLETELATLGQRYDQINGAMTVTFEGREQTLPQMARYQEATDRGVRESAWRAVAERRLRDADAIDAVYDEMVRTRDRLARNAGFGGYVGYAFKAMHRFDYDPAACRRFHEGIERAIVPLTRELDRQRKASLGVGVLRPWDLAVDVKGRGPLRPFEGGADLVRRTRVVMERLDGRLARMFGSLGDGTGRVRTAGEAERVILDLDSRKGKAPGGYQYMLDRARVPFIFMNAAGLHKDVQTMVHEAGHAFHSMLCDAEPLVEYRHSPIEFAEVASMSMELLTMRHMGPGAFYDSEEDFARSMRDQLKRSVTILPWIAQIDAFQHWVYDHPGHTRAERAAAWLGLEERFGGLADWTGLDAVRASLWHRQLHLFTHPLYYVEYGIAQLGALQLWLHSLEAGEASAVERYTRALALGGSRPLPDLFAAAGLAFDFGPQIVKRLADRVTEELAKVPE